MMQNLAADSQPESGIFCAHCKNVIPIFAQIDKAEEQRIRVLEPLQQIVEVRRITGCPLGWAMTWKLHANGSLSCVRHGGPCPYCGVKLFSSETKQCIDCGWDWHDPKNPRNLKVIHSQ
jgi:peptide methionine sulfoxide reductase MsrB